MERAIGKKDRLIKNLEIELKVKSKDDNSPHKNIAKNADMYKSQALSNGGDLPSTDNSQAMKIIRRKNDNLKKENELLRKELETLKEMTNKNVGLDASNQSNQRQAEELAKLTKEVSKLRRYKLDVFNLI